MKINRNAPSQLTFYQNREWSTLAPINVTRPIHYLGSKLRIIDYIYDAINQVDTSNGPICDLFAGSGTVSGAFSEVRDVIAVDIQEYSRVLCSALLKPSKCDNDSFDRFMHALYTSKYSEILSWAVEPLAEYERECQDLAVSGDLEQLCTLLEHGSLIAYERGVYNTDDPLLHTALRETYSRLYESRLIDTPSAMITRYFGGIYFSYLQASQIDMLLEIVATLPLDQKDTFLAATLSTVSDIVNTVGKQFAQPIRPRSSSGKPKPTLALQVSRDRSINAIDVYGDWLRHYLSIPRTDRPHRAICQDYEEALKCLEGEVSVIYADPPYTRDHYSRYYHVLETLCLRDNPDISTVRINGEDHISRGLYRTKRHQSPFCIKSKAPKAFSKLFSGVRRLQVPLVLSYSPYEKQNGARPRLMTIKEIEELAKKHFRRVEVLQVGSISHSKLNVSEKNVGISYNAELLFICLP